MSFMVLPLTGIPCSWNSTALFRLLRNQLEVTSNAFNGCCVGSSMPVCCSLTKNTRIVTANFAEEVTTKWLYKHCVWQICALLAAIHNEERKRRNNAIRLGRQDNTSSRTRTKATAQSGVCMHEGTDHVSSTHGGATPYTEIGKVLADALETQTKAIMQGTKRKYFARTHFTARGWSRVAWWDGTKARVVPDSVTTLDGRAAHNYNCAPLLSEDLLQGCNKRIEELEHQIERETQSRFFLERFSNDNNNIMFLTGFKDYATLKTVYSALQPTATTMVRWSTTDYKGKIIWQWLFCKYWSIHKQDEI